VSAILITGIILFFAFVLGQEFQRLKMPKILGYLLAGVLLNPQICTFVPKSIIAKTNVIEIISIAFIAFIIGGTIEFAKVKKMGRSLLLITFFEAEVAFLAIALGFVAVLPFFAHVPNATYLGVWIPAGLILGCLGSPTDPSAALAVTHEYNARGEVSSTMLGVAAFDDVLGIVNFSIAVVIAKVLVSHQDFSVFNAFVVPCFIISGSVVLGCAMGFIFNLIARRLMRDTEGIMFVLIISFVTVCWGLATLAHVEEVLSVMVMGIFVTNFSHHREKIFKMLERYSEELIFLVFFALSGMQLDLKVLASTFLLVLFFVVFRMLGKWGGTAVGASLANASPNVKKYTIGGLIPYGGIVVGLALIMEQDPVFSKFSNFLVSTVVAATVINEFLGPLFIKRALKKAGEIKQ